MAPPIPTRANEQKQTWFSHWSIARACWFDTTQTVSDKGEFWICSWLLQSWAILVFQSEFWNISYYEGDLLEGPSTESCAFLCKSDVLDAVMQSWVWIEWDSLQCKVRMVCHNSGCVGTCNHQVPIFLFFLCIALPTARLLPPAGRTKRNKQVWPHHRCLRCFTHLVKVILRFLHVVVNGHLLEVRPKRLTPHVAANRYVM